MKIVGIDETLKKINELKNIQAISYRDLSSSTGSKNIIVPGFLVVYDGMKTLFLTVNDKYYQEFIQKLREVYLKEKDNVVEENILGTHHITIDEFTKQLLTEGNLDEVSELYSFYQGKTGYKNRLFFEIDEIKAIASIIKYHIKETLKYFDYVIEFDNQIRGYNGTYSLDATYNGLPTIVPFTINKTSFDTYELKIGGLLTKAIPIKMLISFQEKGLTVNSSIDELKFTNTHIYHLDKEEAYIRKYAYLSGELKAYEVKDLTKGNNEYNNLILTQNGEIINWYQLPWNAMLGYCQNEKASDNQETMKYTRNIYFSLESNYFISKDNSSKKYQKDSTVLTERRSLLLDRARKNTIGIIRNGIALIETSFSSDGVTGFYQTNLSGRYFYHIASSNNFESIDKEKTIPLSRQDGVFDSSDIQGNKIKKLTIRGVEK